MTLYRAIVVPLLLLGASCATAHGTDQKLAANGVDPRKVVHCSPARVVGSNIMVDVCESEEDSDANRAAARELFRNLNSTASQASR
jgi:hypothetical protein